MVLQQRSPSKHNQMLGKKQSTLIPHPASTNFDDDAPSRPVKRVKRAEEDNDGASDYTRSPGSPTRLSAARRVIPDSDAESDDNDDEDANDAPAATRTDLESALPPIQTDKEAIEAYETQRAADEAERLGQDGRMKEGKWVKGRSSIYVDAFNLALDTVLEEECHLFDEAETEVFAQWRALDYEAQYLYVRLFLRKTAAWHRINRLGYQSDIAHLDAAIETLQQARSLPESNSPTQSNPGELEPPEGTTLGSSFTFADRSEDYIDTLEEASSLLKLDELRALAKDAKVQGKNKQELLRSFRKASRKQTGLGWVGLKRSDTDESTKSADGDPDSASTRENTPLPEDANRDAHWVRKIMAETGPCIRLSLPALKLFERVHLVFYRSTEWTEKSLTTIILARIARRNFPDYIVSRSANIFASRALLLEFEASLRTQFRVDNILEFNGTPGQKDLQVILDLFEEVYPRWLVLLQEEQVKEDSIYISGEGAYTRRLSPAWVYTRIVHKTTYVLGKFKQHKREHELLTELLTQRLFHASRRGAWYQRKALLEEHYMAALMPSEGRGEEAQKRHWRQVALQTCEEGLQDPLVHQIYHYDLQKRVTKLEKALKVAKRFQHSFSHVRLAAPVEVTVEGVRLERTEPPPYNTRSRRRRRSNSTSSPLPAARRSIQRTVWLDDEGEGGGECSVEAMCLSHYRARGWKGYHSEGGIVRTLFAHLFLDVLFAYVPNVFQTPFQTCPLDLHTDAFYPTRLSETNHRLVQIANGDAPRLIQEAWDAHAERKTCVVGLDWGFEREDLLEIARCFEGGALATVCRVVAQEYGQRGGGVPDLFLWRPAGSDGGRAEVMFAEVKSEHDRLSDTQRLWIHVLTGAGVAVQLCNAVAREVRTVPWE